MCVQIELHDWLMSHADTQLIMTKTGILKLMSHKV